MYSNKNIKDEVIDRINGMIEKSENSLSQLNSEIETSKKYSSSKLRMYGGKEKYVEIEYFSPNNSLIGENIRKLKNALYSKNSFDIDIKVIDLFISQKEEINLGSDESKRTRIIESIKRYNTSISSYTSSLSSLVLDMKREFSKINKDTNNAQLRFFYQFSQSLSGLVSSISNKVYINNNTIRRIS